MTFVTAIRTCLRKYVTFSGRASRSEYWFFVLFLVLGTVALGFFDMALFGTEMMETGPGQMTMQSNGPLASLFGLATILPALSAGWRRMHDSGRSGFHLLYPLIVIVGIMGAMSFFGGLGPMHGGTSGPIAMIVLVPAFIIFAISPLLVLWWLTRPSEPGTNSYGANPYEVNP
ncbi:DUF805 domain-containing protein [Oceaniovalibus sp. ACAM 378]|uniref:DUF805 domain-containing protein n=1 Tax=Oceaniovalibus sp. ACAM 378 TaxID=2599923 RepID=UPI0011D7BDF5|nr:DUF805 domain-containing protein [Oceaniovalibus sp. ACAM 378]TYB90220.1 DUF805 domain-containing protein [Oceaniovalibus sp. ACAM 378]